MPWFIAVKAAVLTGVGAILVNESTLHSVLKLPVQKDGFITPNMPKLIGNYLKILLHQRRRLELKLFIVLPMLICL